MSKNDSDESETPNCRYRVKCPECGQIESDDDDGLFGEREAYQTAGRHDRYHSFETTIVEDVGGEP